MAASSKPPVGYKCEFLDQVPDNYYCKQCSHVAREPVLTQCCNATMCKACAQESKRDNKPCQSSKCQKPLDNFISHYKIQNQIQALSVCCTRKEEGCVWTGKLKQLDKHLQQKCEYVEVQCEKCKQNVQKRKKNDHKTKQCPERKFSCKYCNFQATYKVVTEKHLGVCTYYILKCPNECGATFERGDLKDHKKMCSLELVKCEFSYTGCEEEFIRDKQQEHMELNTQKHLALVAAATVKTRQAVQEKLQEQQKVYERKICQLGHSLKSEQKRVKSLTELLHSARNEYLLVISATVLIMAIILQAYFYQSQTTEGSFYNETTQMKNANHTINQSKIQELIYELKEETKQKKENKIKLEENEIKLEKTGKKFELQKEETDQKIKELDEKIKHHDEENRRKFKDTERKIEVRKEETDQKIKKLDEKIKNHDKENRRKFKDTERKIEVQKEETDLEIMRLNEIFKNQDKEAKNNEKTSKQNGQQNNNKKHKEKEQENEKGWVEWMKFWE